MAKVSTIAVVAAASLWVAFAASAAKPVRALSRADLPEDFAVGSGTPPLALKVDVVDGKVAHSAPADAAAANVTASGGVEDGETTLSIEHDLDVALKFDLYISVDGERFEYASSCAVTPGISGFEMWKRPIKAFALGHARVVDKGRIACD